MIKLLKRPDSKIFVAVSGGVDSMAALDFLKRKHDVTAAFFHHETKTSDHGLDIVKKYCDWHNINLVCRYPHDDTIERHKSESQEEYWRKIRYDWLNKLEGQVITAHHLDDAVETWVWGCLNGEGKLPNVEIKNILRPFLTTRKQKFIDWATRNGVPYHDDPTNNDINFTRNLIRHCVMPEVMKVNPGIHKVIRKKYL